MTTTNSVKIVFHNGQTATEPLPVFDRDEIKSMTFILGWTSVVLSKTSPSAVEVVVHQLDQQQPPPPPPPPPPASEEENITEIVVQNKEMPPPASEEENITEPVVPNKEINHEEPKQGASGLMISPDNTRNLVMVVATLFLQMAYQAGLNPPGGFWQDDLSAAAARSSAMAASSLAPAPLGGENGGDAMVPHQAGDPILRSKHRSVYLRFKWLNAFSLACSSLLILILMALSFVRSRQWSERGLLAAIGIVYIDLLIILAAYNTGAVTPDNRIISLIPYLAVVVTYSIFYYGSILWRIYARRRNRNYRK